MQWCFDTPKAGPLFCVTSPIQKETLNFKPPFFPEDLKSVKFFPRQSRNDKRDKTNYRLVSVLSLIPKVFERCKMRLNLYIHPESKKLGKLRTWSLFTQ